VEIASVVLITGTPSISGVAYILGAGLHSSLSPPKSYLHSL